MIPSLNDTNFVNQIRQFIFNKNKFEFNKKILKKITDNNFFDSDFNKFVTEKNRIEKMLIKTALERSNGKKNDAAQILGWGRNTLSKKMKEHGI